MTMINIRDYAEPSDTLQVGQLIADTFSEYNLSFTTTEERKLYLGPFQYAGSPLPDHQEAIAQVIRASMVFVAEVEGNIVGVLRGRKDRLQSLFVLGDYHKRGVGRRLVEHFEQACVQQGGREFKVAATRYAVPFYLKLGYKRTTGFRKGRSFEGRELEYQPMKKVIDNE
jgi:GNAT superfamily N-acetyltransferase